MTRDASSGISQAMGTVDEAVLTFRGAAIAHDKVRAADEQISRFWPIRPRQSSDEPHVLLYGHTGTGKTILGRQLLQRHPRRIVGERELVPLIYARTPVPFRPREFYISLLEGYHALAPADAFFVHETKKTVRYERQTEAALRRRVLETAWITESCVWIIDEIQHVLYGSGTLGEHLDRLKVLADEARVMLLVMGTYDALEIMALNAQTIRRFRPILLDRYRCFKSEPGKNGKLDSDTLGFANFVQGLDDRSPRPSNLVAHAPQIHQWTLGLPGLVKPLIAECLQAVLHGSRETITLENLERYRLPDRQLTVLENAIMRDERRDSAPVFDGPPTFSVCKPPRTSTKGRRRRNGPPT